MKQILSNILLLFLSTGCIHENLLEYPDDNSGLATTTLQITTRIKGNTLTGSSAENKVNSIRLIAYEYSATTQTYGNQLANVYKPASEISVGQDLYRIMLNVPLGKSIRILAIANEKTEWNLGNPSMTATDLKEKAIDYLDGGNNVLNIQPPFVMWGESGVITDSESILQEISLTRTVAKVVFKIKCTYADVSGLNGGTLTINNASIERVPQDPYLGEGIPFYSEDESGYINTATQDLTLTPTMEGDIQTGFTTASGDELVFYIPEHIINKKENYSYIQLSGEYTPAPNSSAIKVFYSIPLGDGVQQLYNENAPEIGELTSQDLSITRNTYYMVDATVHSLGSVDGMQVFMQVADWEDGGNINVDIPTFPYLNVSAIKATIAYGKPVRIYFWSNYPEEAISLKTDGKDESGVSFPLSDLFSGSITFTDNGTPTTGYADLYLIDPDAEGLYKIYLNANGLVREIQITILLLPPTVTK